MIAAAARSAAPGAATLRGGGGQATLVVRAGGLEAAALELDAVRLHVEGDGASLALVGCRLRNNNVVGRNVRAPLPLPRHPTLRFG